ncbi:hypothetical protein SAMN04489841_4742 [Natrinema salaciae]|uniref:Uncharacterized protein n=1 Tax=Natrinema salaciae TaxID=1186196 RepID=A0A1H9SNH2_9EURY|nr:hypothetical protein SAMN04489841_4742 [Natrinema salaciae]
MHVCYCHLHGSESRVYVLAVQVVPPEIVDGFEGETDPTLAYLIDSNVHHCGQRGPVGIVVRSPNLLT